MLQAISSYIKTIIMFLIFMSFIELIMPTSSYKKYIDIVLGIILIIIMINPLNNIKAVSLDLNKDLFKNTYELNKSIMQREKNYYEEKNNELIISQYKTQIADNVSAMLGKDKKITVENVNVEVNGNPSDENYSQINKIAVKIKDNKEDAAEKSQIEPIKVVFSNQNKKVSENEKTNNIKKVISDFYNLSADNIYIEYDADSS